MNTKHKDKLVDKNEMVFFEKLFQEYYASLLSYANSFLNNKEVSEDITQDVFMSLWIKKNEINFKGISGAAAVIMILSNGANCGKPSNPSP